MGIRIKGNQWPAVERSTAAWLRRRLPRRRQAAVAGAIEHVVYESLRYIRAMADRRESMCSDIFPGIDYHQQITELAGLSMTLLPALDPSGPDLPADTLQSTWDTRSMPQQHWIRRCLAVHDIAVNDVIDLTRPDHP
ncbi:MAG TPA: hypothetical protein VHX38_00420 [Pseudonocardiaceae bacterium]|nr:hypothetical protein [Pseudonocardiaceae bacterium]